MAITSSMVCGMSTPLIHRNCDHCLGELNCNKYEAYLRRVNCIFIEVISILNMFLRNQISFLLKLIHRYLLTLNIFWLQVQGTLKRQWMQYKTQWGQRRRDHCSTRSTSYTATSITEVPVYLYHHDSNSEHLNGKYIHDSELVALKSGETFA